MIFSQNPSLSSQTWFLSYRELNWMKLWHKGHLNIRNKFPKEVFSPNSKISFPILDELKNLDFGGWNWGGQSHGFNPRLELDDDFHRSTQIHGRNRRKLLKSRSQKSGQKYLQKSWKWKTLQLKIGDELTQTHGCIDTNQESTRCGNHPNILPLFGRLGRPLTSLLSSLRHEAHTTPSKMKTQSQGGGRGIPPTIALWFYL
jgi:hypothetical protein